MLGTSRGWPLRYRWTLIAGALLLLAGCGDSETGTFSGTASEKAAAEKGLGPGALAKKAAPPPLVRNKSGQAPRTPGGGLASPD
jgi:hypothetical protein